MAELCDILRDSSPPISRIVVGYSAEKAAVYKRGGSIVSTDRAGKRVSSMLKIERFRAKRPRDVRESEGKESIHLAKS